MSVVFFAFFALFLAIGLAMLGYGARVWWKSNRVAEWPTVQGTLLERELTQDSDSDGTTYRVKVRYAYTVGSYDFQSDRIAFGYMGSSGRASHQAIYDKLMRGETVRVRYDPADHTQAALVFGLNNSTLMLIIFGTVWTMFTLGLMLLFWIGSRPDALLVERLIVQ